MMDPTASYLLISNNNNNNNLLSNGDSIISGLTGAFSDFEQSTSDASSGSPSHYGDPFVGGLSYFEHHPTSAMTATAPTSAQTTTPSRVPLLSPANLANNNLNHHQDQQQQHQHHSIHHNHHQLHNHHHSSNHHHSHHLSQNHLHHLNGSSLPNSNPPSSLSSASLIFNINNFSLEQLVDHSVIDDDLDQNITSMPYLDHNQLGDHSDLSSSLMITGCELDDDEDHDDHDDLIHGGTLTSFVCADLGSDSDNGYTSGVSDGLFTSSSSLVDCSDSLAASDAYCFKQFSFSDLQGLIDVNSTAPKQMASSTEKRSVLMNLLVYGSDIGAGYTSIKR